MKIPSHKLIQAAQMRVMGVETGKIASELGLNEQSLAVLFTQNKDLVSWVDHFKGVVADECESIFRKQYQIIARRMPRLVSRLISFAMGEEINGKVPHGSLQMQAINSLMDRVGMARISKSESTRENTFGGLSNNERGAIIDAMINKISKNGSKNTHIEPERMQTIELSDSSQNENDVALQEVIEEPTKNLT